MYAEKKIDIRYVIYISDKKHLEICSPGNRDRWYLLKNNQ